MKFKQIFYRKIASMLMVKHIIKKAIFSILLISVFNSSAFGNKDSADFFFETAKNIQKTNTDSAVMLYNKAISGYEKNNDYQGVYQSSYYLARFYQSNNLFNSAIFITDKALDIIPPTDSLNVSRLFSLKGRLLSMVGRSKEGVSTLLKAIVIQEKIDQERLPVSYVNIALCFLTLTEYEKGIKYLKMAIVEDEKVDNQDGIAQSYINLSSLYFQKGEEETAMEYLNKAHEIVKATGMKIGLAFFYHHSALMRMEHGDYEGALNYIQQDLAIRHELGDQKGIGYALYNLGVYYDKTNQPVLAEKFLLKSLEKAKELGLLTLIMDVNIAVSEFYSHNGEHKKAYDYLLEYNIAKDSIFDVSKAQAAIEMENIYESQKKDQQLASKELILQRQNSKIELLEIQQEIDNKNKFLLVLLLSLGFTVVIAIIVLRYFKKQKTMEENYAKNLILSQEEERKRIATELHDSVGQKLSLARSGLALLEQKEGADSDISEQLDTVINELRTISRNMHPAELETLGLSTAIKSLLERVEKFSKLHTTYEIDEIEDLLNLEQKINCYRIVQEFINNTLKHAEATAVRVELEIKNQHLVLKMNDNGIGFNSSKNNKEKGFGLSSIDKRVKLLNGKIDTLSEKGKGTRTEIVFPLDE